MCMEDFPEFLIVPITEKLFAYASHEPLSASEAHEAPEMVTDLSIGGEHDLWRDHHRQANEAGSGLAQQR